MKRDQDQESYKETESDFFFFCPEATSSNLLTGGIVTYSESLELPEE